MVDKGREGWRMMGAMATASMPVDLRVLRAAASQTRSLPVYGLSQRQVVK